MTKKNIESLSEIALKQTELYDKISPTIAETLASHSSMVEKISPTVIQVAQDYRDFVERLSPTMFQMAASYSSMAQKISPTVIQVAQDYRDFVERLSPTMFQVAASYSSMVERISPVTIQLVQEHRDFINQISPTVNQYIESYRSLLEQINTQSLTNLLTQVDVSDVIAAINHIEYPELNEGNNEIQVEITISNNTNNYLTETEIIELINDRFQSVQLNEKSIIRKFFEELAISIGVDMAKGLLYGLLALLVVSLGVTTSSFHEKIMHDIQEKADNNVVIKHYLEEQGLLNYEHLKLIGITRVETFIRAGRSKIAPLNSNIKLEPGTVVSLLERKNNWIKVQVDRENYCIEGWVEESKVNKFKNLK